MTTVNTLDTIELAGHTIVVAPEEEVVFVRPICESIGIDFSSQRKRIERQPWATVVIMTTVASDGATREQVALPKGQVPMWLATISVNKVRDPRARAALVLFQKRCAEVLDAYWSGRMLNTLERPTDADTLRATRWLARLERDWQGRVINRLEHLEAARREYHRMGVVTEVDTPEMEYLRRSGGREPFQLALVANQDQEPVDVDDVG